MPLVDKRNIIMSSENNIRDLKLGILKFCQNETIAK